MRIPGPLLFLVLLMVCGRHLAQGQISIPAPWQENFSPHRSFDLNEDELLQILSSATSRWDQRGELIPATVHLPLPEGGTAVFDIWRSEQMEPELAALFPSIQTFFGQDQDNHRRNIYLLATASQFKILYFDERGMNSRLEPDHTSLANYHFSYRSNWGRAPDLAKACQAELDEDAQRFQETSFGTARRGETKMYRYRMALATTGEYGHYHGDTKEEVLIAMNELLLQVNAIFERESSVHFDLVAGNESIIFLDPENDPYDNTDVDQMLETNKMVCNYSIGYSNFDVGHVLSTKFGGQAHIGSICNFSRKAKAFTGLEQPEGYYMGAIFAHELAHQIGARHTQSNDCNRDLPTSFEPGSGSTIMAYAGICEPNVQDVPDDYFHGNSLELIAKKAAQGLVFGCVPGTRTTNLPPQVDAGPDLYVPVGTPFHLKGLGADPNGDSLLYQWEQMDAMAATDTLNLNGPIFRSIPPSSSPERTLGAENDIWEQLPTHTRSARFRLTAKDLHLGMGSSVYDEMTVYFIDSIGPFTVLTANTAGQRWEVGSMQTVSWDEAGTSTEPVLCQTVDIYLSSNGGQDYDVLLATQIPNNGSALVNIPLTTGQQFRLKVSCSNGTFFDTANELLEIYDPNAPTPVDTMIMDTTIIIPPDTMVVDTTIISPPDTTVMDTTIVTPPVDTMIMDTTIITPPDTMMMDTTITLPPVDTIMHDSLDMPVDTMVQDTIENPLPDTLEQPGMDTIDAPPIDTTVSMPMDSLTDPPLDTIPVPPADTLTDPPLDTITTPPADTLIDVPMDTIPNPPNDSMDTMPTDTIPTPPGDTLTPAEPDTIMTRPEENPVDTTSNPGDTPPEIPPTNSGDTCDDCLPTVSMAPNPTSGDVHYRFHLQQAMIGNIEVINNQGRILQRRRLTLPPGANEIQLDLSTYPGGMYWVRLVSEHFVMVRPVVLR